jgi:hypothetical protein
VTCAAIIAAASGTSAPIAVVSASRRSRTTSAIPPANAAATNERPPTPNTRADPLIHDVACKFVPRCIHPKPNGGWMRKRNVSSATQAAGAAIASGKRSASLRNTTPATAMYAAGTIATARSVIHKTYVLQMHSAEMPIAAASHSIQNARGPGRLQ